MFERRNSASAWPETFICKFIVPGLVAYDEYGTVLVRKEALEKMAPSIVGKPVINEIHKQVDPSVYENADADGIVTRVWYDQNDGWYWCEYIVWDDTTKLNCRSKAYSVSCAYDVNNFKTENGTFNNVPYEQEVLDGSYTHLAIVANPRYEDARIVVMNSKGGSDMKLKFWEKKNELKNVGPDTLVDVDGKPVSIQAMIEAHNAKSQPLANISDDTTIEIDGKEIKVSDLKNSYRASLKNEDEESDEDKKKKAKEAEERKNAEDDADKKKKEKEAEDMKNAEDKAKADDEKKKKDEMENSLKNAGAKHFNDLKTAAELRGVPQEIKVTTQSERMQAGRQKYGSAA